MAMIDKVKLLRKQDVIIKDIEGFHAKICSLANDGPQMLQILADYDATLTKYSVDGKVTPHSIDVFQMTEGLSETYSAGRSVLLKKYGTAYHKAKTDTERNTILLQWWDDHEALVTGEKVTLEAIQEAAASADIPLRKGIDLLFHLLKSHEVPVTVISAGIGEVVSYSLQKFKPEVLSNFMKFDDEKILGFIKPTISVHNKHELKSLVTSMGNNERHNVIVLGDSLGDCTMANGITNKKTVIKIGFLNEVGNNLKAYCDHFDMVLLNDQSLDAVNDLLKLILKPIY